MHINPITDFYIWVIPEAILQARVFKFGTVGALNTLINKVPGFLMIAKFYFWRLFDTLSSFVNTLLSLTLAPLCEETWGVSINCNMMNWRISNEAINTVTIWAWLVRNSWQKSYFYIESSTNIGIVFKHFIVKWYWIQLHLIMLHSLTTMLFIASLYMKNPL